MCWTREATKAHKIMKSGLLWIHLGIFLSRHLQINRLHFFRKSLLLQKILARMMGRGLWNLVNLSKIKMGGSAVRITMIWVADSIKNLMRKSRVSIILIWVNMRKSMLVRMTANVMKMTYLWASNATAGKQSGEAAAVLTGHWAVTLTSHQITKMWFRTAVLNMTTTWQIQND